MMAIVPVAVRAEHGRLHDLYEVCELLLRLDGDETSSLAVHAVIARALPVRSVVLLLGGAAPPRVVGWHADPRQAGRAEARARDAFRYFVEPVDLTLEEGPRVVLLPLVHARSTLGALQVELAGDLGEEDLVFLGAVANLIAVAAGRQARLAAAEASRAAAQVRGDAAETVRAQVEALVDNLDQAFLWEAEAGSARVLYVSGRGQELLGLPREGWLASPDPWAACVHPEDLGAFRDMLARAAHTRQDQRCEHRCLTATGRVRWLHTGVHAGGSRLQAVSIDVTLSKEAAAAVRRELDFNQAVTGCLGEGVLAVDARRRVSFLNPAARRLLGLADDQALGAPVEQVLRLERARGGPLPPAECPLGLAMAAGAPVRSDDHRVAPAGREPFPVSYTCVPLTLDGRVLGAVLAFQDVLPLKRAVEAREELLRIVSHDLRTSLHALLLAAHLVRGEVPEGRAGRAASTVVRVAEGMHRLIADLLDVSSAEAGHLALDLREVPVATLLGDVVDLLAGTAARRALRLDAEPAGADLRVRCDRGRVLQVLTNLASNALKFTPPGGSVTLRARARQREAVVEVHDTGPGIAPEDLPRVFGRFWQARRTAHLGSGLGLSIARGIVESHGGRIWVESRPGAGCTFSFTLPLAAPL